MSPMAETLYHVATGWAGGDLLPLSHKYRAGNEVDAVEQWLERWPDGSPELAAAHVHLVHLYATEDEARTHAEHFGGTVYEITADDCDGLAMCDLEFDHPVCRRVPAAAIRAI